MTSTNFVLMISNSTVAARNVATYICARTRTPRTLRTPQRKTLHLKMRALDLCAGTHSFTRVAEQLGWEVISVDISQKYSPTIVGDVLEIDYKQWPPGHFDFVWCSPPCETFSVACAHLFDADGREARAQQGNAVARKTREILDYLDPKFYVVENPLCSLIWKQGIYEDLPKKKVSYCMYGFPYRKNTLLATNVPFEPKLCCGGCGNVRQVMDAHGKMHIYHLEVAKQGASQHTRGLGVQQSRHSRDQLYRVPEQLIRDILESIS